MTDTKLSKIEKKKKELEQELSKIQDDIDQSIDGVKEDVSNSISPKNLIRKYPIPIVGASLFIGFMFGRNRKDGNYSSVKNINKKSENPISKEIKHALAKKGISLLLDYLENKVSALNEKNPPLDR